ncbi:hypothetical protein F53441_11467 [Fusarium austroafricanum]|uniref:Uncharacterized protein n=1 Tax=Fusarium austroafricanum TaxID=2364996 RepID=A0A8H4K400_9HYPO|nr:hypothetical protein F53441_11467 [Fusarium austroafricanum]
MVNRFTIIINNRTGSSQSYSLITEKPNVSGIDSNVWPSVFQTAEDMPDGAQTTFEMYKNYYARNNAFEMTTKNDFTLNDATEGNIFVWVGSSPDDYSSAAIATFRPEPGNRYQIQPLNTFYVASGGNREVG